MTFFIKRICLMLVHFVIFAYKMKRLVNVHRFRCMESVILENPYLELSSIISSLNRHYSKGISVSSILYYHCQVYKNTYCVYALMHSTRQKTSTKVVKIYIVIHCIGLKGHAFCICYVVLIYAGTAVILI